MSTFISIEKPFSKEWFKVYTYILLGTLALAIGYVYFINPHKIVPGGIYGIAIIIHHKLGFPIGLTALAFNIPLTFVGLKVLGPRFGVKTIVGFVLTSIFIDVMNYFSQSQPLVEDDLLLSAAFGGIFIGVGVGLIFKAKATVGGTDTIAMIVSKYTSLPLGHSMMAVDSVIVAIGLFAFGDWKIPLYSLVTIFIMGKLIDLVLEGVKYEKALMIISEKHEEISVIIMQQLKRSGTYLDSSGMYSGQPGKTIFTVVNRREISLLKQKIKEVDPRAFVTVFETSEILGNGFKSLDD